MLASQPSPPQVSMPTGFYLTHAYDCNSMNGNCGQLGFFAQQVVDFSTWKSTDPLRTQGPTHDSHLLHTCFSFHVPIAVAPHRLVQ